MDMKRVIAYSIFFYLFAISLSWAACIEGNCLNKKGTFIFSDGSKYVGQWKNGQAHGQGTSTWPDGEKYVGEYRNGLRHGQGTWSDAKGNKYVGRYWNGLRDGQGTWSDAAGNKYVGKYRNGKLHGEGTFTFANGEKYVGEFKDNKPNGQGTSTWPDGKKYVGGFKDDKFNGQGTLTWPDGKKYVGEFKDDRYNGKGTFTFSNGQKHIGEFRDGKRNGQGTETWPSGQKYVGGWKDDKRHGEGTFTFPNFEEYVGQWKNGKRDGKGTATYVDGSKYVGQWKDNERHGKGALTYNDEWVEKGIFKNGRCQNCNISVAKKVKKTCLNNPSLCTVAQLCSNATTEKNQKKVWGTSNSAQPFVKEAKKNGVTCGVETNPAKTNKQKDIFKVASGSGFYVSKAGHVVTNHHVIDGCRDVKIVAKGTLINTDVIASDQLNDLALLKANINPPYVFPISSEAPFGMQEIVVAGYPFGNKLSSSIKFTKGIVSSLTGVGDNYSEIQIDAALQPGNSGGPIIDEYGNVMAVAVAKLDVVKIVEDFGTLPENTNFGIKASTLVSLLKSHEIPLVRERKKEIKPRDLSKNATDGTVFLTCWMTKAQIESYKKKKAMFEEFGD